MKSVRPLKLQLAKVDCPLRVSSEKSKTLGVVKREDLFVATKLWNTFHKPEDVVKGCDKSLENLRIKQIGWFY